jgi:hypothetical protein
VFVVLGLLDGTQTKIIEEEQRRLVKLLAPESMNLIKALDVKAWMCQAPIANDWVAYNVHDNRGELVGLPSKL